MFEGLTPAHLVFVLVIAMLVLGPGKLPELGAALGRGIRDFRNAVEGKDELAVPSRAEAPRMATPVADGDTDGASKSDLRR